MGIKNQEYKDFSLRIHQKALRKPFVGQFELTHRCNLSCQHCYIVNDSKKEELTYNELCRIFDEIYEEGCLWLCLSGGEPLLREDFLDIYSHAYKKGFIITIFTNATLFNDQILEYLKEFPPFCIEVTLNGATKKTYELISQRPGSFEKAMQGIRLIRKYKLPLKLKCQAMSLNIDELSLMRIFYEKMGMKFRCSVIIDPRMDGSTQPCSLRLPIEKILELRNRKEVVRGRDEIEDNFLKDELLLGQEIGFFPVCDNLFSCGGGIHSFYVNPFGELFFCNSLRKPSWDLRKNPFKQGFYEFFSKIGSAKFETNSKCRDCKISSFCYRCPGKAYLETGDKEAPVSYYCELAKAMEQAVSSL